MAEKINDGMNAKSRYEAKMKKVQIELHKENDKDIIEFLETVPSKQAFIKQLIRKEIEKKKSWKIIPIYWLVFSFGLKFGVDKCAHKSISLMCTRKETKWAIKK